MAMAPRTRYFIDRKLQGALALRIVAYWLGCGIFGTFALILWRIFTGPARPFYTHFDDIWFHYSTAYILWLILLPVFLVDFIRFSNRFAGPVFRLRGAMRRLAAGELVDPIMFRKGDFWRSFADEFNDVAARLETLERELAQARRESRREETLVATAHVD